MHALAPFNQAPLTIRTFDGLDDPYHPSVSYFPQGWNGYRFWMTESPFSLEAVPYRDVNEIPSIHVSQDGIHWEEPPGLINPIVSMSREDVDKLDYYSDPHIVMRDNTMEVWYRKTERHGEVGNHEDVSLRKVCSTDGVHWSDEIIINKPQQEGSHACVPGLFLCPTLLWNTDGYTMYAVRYRNSENAGSVVVTHSRDGNTWSDEKLCHLEGAPCQPWHIDVQCYDGVYWLVVYDRNRDVISLWKSTDGINFAYVRELLRPSHVRGSFYRCALYRACLVRVESRYYLYFTASDIWDTYIGIMVGDSPESLEIISVDGEDRGVWEYAYERYRYAARILKYKAG